MTEYTVHFQKGTRVGARSVRMITVEALSPKTAIQLAKARMIDQPGFKVTKVDHFEGGRLAQD